MNFDQAFDALIGNEGGYSNNSVDPGAETMWGVTARVARANGYQGDMRMLPRDTAKAIYQRMYWAAARCDELPGLLRFQVFDAAVNSGVTQAVLWLQRAVGVEDDGVLGPRTLAAAGGTDALRTGIVFDALRLAFLADRPTWPAFGRGWARRIASNLTTLAKELTP